MRNLPVSWQIRNNDFTLWKGPVPHLINHHNLITAQRIKLLKWCSPMTLSLYAFKKIDILMDYRCCLWSYKGLTKIQFSKWTFQRGSSKTTNLKGQIMLIHFFFLLINCWPETFKGCWCFSYIRKFGLKSSLGLFTPSRKVQAPGITSHKGLELSRCRAQ